MKKNTANNLGLLFGGFGFLLQILSQAVKENLGPDIASAILVGGSVLLIAGLCFYAVSKGRSPFWGALGFLSCAGILILALLPKKSGDEK